MAKLRGGTFYGRQKRFKTKRGLDSVRSAYAKEVKRLIKKNDREGLRRLSAMVKLIHGTQLHIKGVTK